MRLDRFCSLKRIDLWRIFHQHKQLFLSTYAELVIKQVMSGGKHYTGYRNYPPLENGVG